MWAVRLRRHVHIIQLSPVRPSHHFCILLTFSFGAALPTTDKKEEAQPAASAGAFSFGGAAATVTTDKKDETKPAAGGFSFGGSTAASTTEKKEATTVRKSQM